MPGYDRTGPMGQGPMTGRGFGPCGRGFNRGFGYGRGFGWRARAFSTQQIPIQQQVITETEEKKILQNELKILKEDMKEIEERLKEFNKKK